jgi:3-phosphoshikimate 1-carboxyvinyltransferase
LDGKVEVRALKKPICARLEVPGSKSYTNRALIMAALTKGAVYLENPLYCQDTVAMINCLRALGLNIQTEPHQIVVVDDIESVQEKKYHLFAHESGTTARFLLSLLCLVPGVKILEGSKRLNERPIKDLVDSLKQLGAKIDYCNKEGELPVKIFSSTLSGQTVQLKSHMSSQFCSALLLIAPYFSKQFTLHVEAELISRPYVDMTLNCMQEWGVDVKSEGNAFSVSQRYQKKRYAIEGDFSSSCYFFALAALTRSTISVENLNPYSLQPDRKFLKILKQMGNSVSDLEKGVCVEGKQISALEIDMQECPDQVMTLAILAAFAKGVTKISGVRSLRVKETDRVLALRSNLNKMGIETEQTHDTLTIYGGAPHAAQIDSCNDHRIAMAFAIAGSYLPGITICEPQVVNKTFPAFWDLLGGLH